MSSWKTSRGICQRLIYSTSTTVISQGYRPFSTNFTQSNACKTSWNITIFHDENFPNFDYKYKQFLHHFLYRQSYDKRKISPRLQTIWSAIFVDKKVQKSFGLQKKTRKQACFPITDDNEWSRPKYGGLIRKHVQSLYEKCQRWQHQ